MAEEEKSDAQEAAAAKKEAASAANPVAIAFRAGGGAAGASTQSVLTEFSEIVYEDRECLDDGDSGRTRLLNCVIQHVWPSDGFESSDGVVRTWCELIVSSAERESDAFNTRGKATTPTFRNSEREDGACLSLPLSLPPSHHLWPLPHHSLSAFPLLPGQDP